MVVRTGVNKVREKVKFLIQRVTGDYMLINIMKILFILSIFLILQGCAFIGNQSPRLVVLQDGICQDTLSRVMWQIVKSERISNIEEARNYAQKQIIGGYDDWRLPTVFELYNLYYLHDVKAESECKLDLKGNFWSDEKDGEGMVGAWEIGDQCDPERDYSPSKTGFVRLIRP